MHFKLPDLPYEYTDLSKSVDEETMRTHHTKHHQAYVTKLNAHLKSAGVQEMPLLELVQKCKKMRVPSVIDKAGIVNNCGGHFNHSLFWQMMSPDSNVEDICPELRTHINSHFKSFDDFKKNFKDNAVSLFGSGWVWLMYQKKSKSLAVVKCFNQDNKVMWENDDIPLLGLDVWEHAYYLRYKNDRGGYIDKWWDVVNWKFISKVYTTFALGEKPFFVELDGTVKFD